MGERRGTLAGSSDMCEAKSGGGGPKTPSALPEKWGGERSPCTPRSYAYGADEQSGPVALGLCSTDRVRQCTLNRNALNTMPPPR